MPFPTLPQNQNYPLDYHKKVVSSQQKHFQIIKIMAQNKTNNQFSIFGCGYRNPKGQAVLAVKPEGATDIAHVYQFIISDQAKAATNRLREMAEQSATREELSDYKKLNFRIATFSGTFSYRNAKSLTERSPYLVIDVDDLESEAEARLLMQRFISDPYVETELCFLSPKGRGVKWVISLPEWWQNLDFRLQFEAARQHVIFNYGIPVDTSGSDVCRACFLPCDPQCYVNPKHMSNK
jgi:hypothetical protein